MGHTYKAIMPLFPCGTHRDQKGGLDPLRLELETLESHRVGQGTELRSLGTAASALNCSASCPAP